MIQEGQLTTAGTANTAQKQELMMDYPITRWVSAKNGLRLGLFAVPAVFAVVKLSVSE